ncbi:MAG: 3-isopropylmalate dehydratase small subunit [Verrucomicrobia bacterium]|nr:3-isopropylmalate dehydratase small subunit [Verrucomicrobiota bacterium]
MALAKITSVTGRAVNVPGNDIDTDRIIPARFMKCVTFDGLGEFLFYDVRKNLDGTDKPHPLNEERFKGATILLSGANFGCGSSREHAPQAIAKYGFKAVIAENFAEIFFGNSTTLGIPCVTASREDIAKIAAATEADPRAEVVIDLVKLEARFAGQSVKIAQRESARDALVNGRWDAIGELLDGRDAVKATAAKLPYLAA